MSDAGSPTAESPPVADVLVLGLGNPLMGDDGVGAAVIEELLRVGLPEGLRAELAADILQLPSVWQGETDVWLVDAVSLSSAPGTIHLLDHAEILTLRGNHRSAHQLSLPEGLRWLAHSYQGLRSVAFRLWGVEPEMLTATPRLSREVAAAVTEVARAIYRSAPMVPPIA
jgi:hydrogenase maturation protease